MSDDLSITDSSNSVTNNKIPNDLLIEIFSRVHAKSIVRFRCLSKFWESTLGSNMFNELFLAKSMTRSQILFTMTIDKDIFIFSSPQPNNPHENSSVLATRCHLNLPEHHPSIIVTPVCGFVLVYDYETKHVILNPATGKSLDVPKFKETGEGRSYIGYDPINKEYKLLVKQWGNNTHCVLTLDGTGKWRTFQEPTLPYSPLYHGVCINGILYFKTSFDEPGSDKLACFDVRSEKLTFVNLDEDMQRESCYIMFNYNDKLCEHHDMVQGNGQVLWVLEDAGKHQWSKIVMSHLWNTVVRDNKLFIVGMTGTSEIALAPYHLIHPYYLFFYNMEKDTFTRVLVQGLEEFNYHDSRNGFFIHPYANYNENLKMLI